MDYQRKISEQVNYLTLLLIKQIETINDKNSTQGREKFFSAMYSKEPKDVFFAGGIKLIE